MDSKQFRKEAKNGRRSSKWRSTFEVADVKLNPVFDENLFHLSRFLVEMLVIDSKTVLNHLPEKLFINLAFVIRFQINCLLNCRKKDLNLLRTCCHFKHTKKIRMTYFIIMESNLIIF